MYYSRIFLKNVVLHNIMCKTNWIVIRTQCYRLFCEKKGFPYRVPLKWWQKYSDKLLGRKGPFWSFLQVLAKDGREVHFILLCIRIKFLFEWYESSLSIIFLYQPFSSCWPKTNVQWIKPPVTQTPQCTSPISHNVPVYNQNVHNSVAKSWVVGYFSEALEFVRQIY